MRNEPKPKAFQCYLDNYTVLEHLSDSEAGQLWKMLFRLARGGERETAGDPLVDLAYDIMANALERDFAAYAEKVRTMSENGKKGAAKRQRRREEGGKSQQTSAIADNCSQYKEKEKDKEKDKDKDKEKDKDKDKDKDKEKEKDSAPSGAPVPAASAASVSAVVALYHRCCPDLPRVGQVTEQLSLRLARLPTLDFAAYFQRVGASDFLTGRNGKWKGCTLDWLLRPDTVQKVNSGLYDNREPTAAVTSYDIRELEQIDRMEWLE